MTIQRLCLVKHDFVCEFVQGIDCFVCIFGRSPIKTLNLNVRFDLWPICMYEYQTCVWPRCIWIRHLFRIARVKSKSFRKLSNMVILRRLNTIRTTLLSYTGPTCMKQNHKTFFLQWCLDDSCKLSNDRVQPILIK